MREILFRGKRVDNGEWIKGYLAYGNIIKTVRKCYDWRGDYAFDSLEEHKIDKETVGQYTGLTDKNGKKIFEGDILQEYNGEDRGYIRYDESDGMYYLVVDNVLYDFSTCNSKWYEVIGNIHDNKQIKERLQLSL